MIGPAAVDREDARPAFRDDGADLLQALTPPPRTLRAVALRRRGYRERWRVPAAGTMTVGWYQASTGTLVAHATRSVSGAANPAVTIGLSRAGRTLLTRHTRLRLIVRGTLAPKGWSVLRATGPAIRVS